MKAASLVIAVVSCVTLAGCVLKGPEVRVAPPVEVKVDGDNGNGNGGKFCPPGQAKKGRC